MNIEEILQSGNYITENNLGLSEFNIDLFIPLFEKEFRVNAYNLYSKEVGLDNVQLGLLARTLHQIKNFDDTNAKWIKEEVWKHYNAYMASTSYGMVDYSTHDTEEDANRHFFGIEDMDQAFKTIELESVHFDLDQMDYQHFIMSFTCPWEEEHGISICMSEGELEYVE